MRRSIFRSSLTLAFCVLLPLIARAETRYRVVELPIPHRGWGLNAHGDVAGVQFSPSGDGSPVLVESHVLIPVPPLMPNGNGRALAVNDRGEVVGDAMTPLSAPFQGLVAHAYIWTRTGDSIDLTKGSSGASFAYAINNHGEVVGYEMKGDESGVYIWRIRPDGSVEAELIGEQRSLSNTAWDVNDAGLVVGASFDNAWAYDSRTKQLENLPFGARGQAIGVNERGDVVGQSRELGYAAAMWQKVDGKWEVTSFGGLPGVHGNCVAIEINNAGTIVGECVGPQGVPSRGFIVAGGALRAADDLLVAADTGVWEIRGIWDINESGTILGQGLRNGRSYPVLLEPVVQRRRGTRLPGR